MHLALQQEHAGTEPESRAHQPRDGGLASLPATHVRRVHLEPGQQEEEAQTQLAQEDHRLRHGGKLQDVRADGGPEDEQPDHVRHPAAGDQREDGRQDGCENDPPHRDQVLYQQLSFCHSGDATGGTGRGLVQLQPRADGLQGCSGGVAHGDGRSLLPWESLAVAPRPTYRRYDGQSPVVWAGQHEDREDESVWAVACFVVRTGARGEGLTYELARAAVDFARGRGAVALEGYPIVARDGREVVWDEASVGTPQVFAAAGMEQVSAPTARRRVMRIDF